MRVAAFTVFVVLFLCIRSTRSEEEAADAAANEAPAGGASDSSNARKAPRQKTKELMKPSFIPYCVTRDVCKPVCDCAVYENCELLEMNAEVRNKLLVALNEARSIQSKGEPQASGMPVLMYDTELEEISKCWAARCDDEYSECFRTPYYTETTQTVGLLPLALNITDLPLTYWDRTIQIWLGEVRKTNAEIVSSLPAGKHGEEVHSYAQILADRIHKVGCAWSRLHPEETGGEGGGSNKEAAAAEAPAAEGRKKREESTESSSGGEVASLIFVCTFAPRGPRQGEAIFKTGKACTTCDEGTMCDYRDNYPFLCKEADQVEQREITGSSMDEDLQEEEEERPRSPPPKKIPPHPEPSISKKKKPTFRKSGSSALEIDRFIAILLLPLCKLLF